MVGPLSISNLSLAATKPQRTPEGMRYVWSWLSNQPVLPATARKRAPAGLLTHQVAPGSFLFGDQDVNTRELFEPPWHTVEFEESPHVQYLEGDQEFYARYMRRRDRSSPLDGESPDPAARFDAIRQSIADGGLDEPVVYCTRPDGRKVLTEGYHRAAVAYHLDRAVSAVEIPLPRFLWRQITLSVAYYGTNGAAIPYESLYYNGEEHVIGRRRDLLDRIALVDRADIVDARVLDLGSNIGASSFLAIEQRAGSKLGVELDHDMVTSAIRANVAFAFPCEFKQHDLSQPLSLSDRFDTGFCFAVDKHVDNDEVLAGTIADHVEDVLYFETHPERTLPDPIAGLAETIEYKGETGTNHRCDFYKLVL